MSALSERLRDAWTGDYDDYLSSDIGDAADLIDAIEGHTTTVPPDLPDNMNAEEGWAAAMWEIHCLILRKEPSPPSDNIPRNALPDDAAEVAALLDDVWLEDDRKLIDRAAAILRGDE